MWSRYLNVTDRRIAVAIPRPEKALPFRLSVDLLLQCELAVGSAFHIMQLD